MSLPPGFLDEIRARVPLSQVVGRHVAWDPRKSSQGRGDWWAPCPFHQEKTPSFHVDDRKGFYYCFGCQAKGDLFTFLREVEGMAFIDAVRAMAAEAGLAMPAETPQARARSDRRSQLVEVMEQAVRWFRLQLQTGAAGTARDYLAGRGLDDAALERFEIGYAPDLRNGLTRALTERGVALALIDEAGLCITPDDGGAPFDRFRGRIMFPIRDARGRAIAFGGRALDPGARAKYLNSPETPLFDKGRNLYHLGPARGAVGKGAPLIVTEGYMDVIALARAGFEGVVAPLGTAITEDQLRLLWRVSPEPIIALDGDGAGLRAAMRLVDLALPMAGPGQALRFAILPEGQDPDDLIRRGGRAAMAGVIESARPLIDLLWQRETEGHVFDSPERRAALGAELNRALARIADAPTRGHFEAEIRARMGRLFGRGQSSGRSRSFGRSSDQSSGQRTGRPYRRGGADRAPAAADEVRAQTRASRLVAAGGDSGERLIEAAILLTCAGNPDLVAGLAGRLERLVPSGADRAALLHDLLAGTTSDAGRAALDALRRDPHLRHSPAASGSDPERAALIVGNCLDRLEARRAHRAELARAEAEIDADTADEGLTWRVAELARARDAADRPRLTDLADAGEDAEAELAAIEAWLGVSRAGPSRDRGGPG